MPSSGTMSYVQAKEAVQSNYCGKILGLEKPLMFSTEFPIVKLNILYNLCLFSQKIRLLTDYSLCVWLCLKKKMMCGQTSFLYKHERNLLLVCDGSHKLKSLFFVPASLMQGWLKAFAQNRNVILVAECQTCLHCLPVY